MTGGKQYKVRERRTFIEESPVGGDKVEFSRFWLCPDDGLKVGFAPGGAKGEAEIVKQGRHRKIRILKYKAETVSRDGVIAFIYQVKITGSCLKMIRLYWRTGSGFYPCLSHDRSCRAGEYGEDIVCAAASGLAQA